MKKTLFLFVVFTIAVSANIAMPGFWNTGGGRNFVPFLKEDSLFFGKVQMQKEFITVLLYPGYAVVKGQYIMKNLTDKKISLRVGFPVNGRFDAAGVENVMFNELSNLTVRINGRQTKVYDLFTYLQEKGKDYSTTAVKDSVYNSVYATEKNWYVWESDFAAGDSTVIDVYYILPTNDASLLKGYDRSNENGFSYILETGSTWGGVIDTGIVRVYLMDGLNYNKLVGVYPTRMQYREDSNLLSMEIYGYKPRWNDNIVIRYGKRLKDFDYSAVTARTADLFSLADTYALQTRLPLPEVKNSETIPLPDDFKPRNELLTYTLWTAAVLATLGILYFILKK